MNCTRTKTNLTMKFKYFKYSEFDSPDEPGSGEKFMSDKLIMMLDLVRKDYGRPMVINSGYRTEAYNKKVGGVNDSSHMKGVAVDIRIKGSRDRFDLVACLIKHKFNRIGIGETFIHADIDETKDPDVIWLY
jgi:uncharacterized protein YcbK (DUF882 family)